MPTIVNLTHPARIRLYLLSVRAPFSGLSFLLARLSVLNHLTLKTKWLNNIIIQHYIPGRSRGVVLFSTAQGIWSMWVHGVNGLIVKLKLIRKEITYLQRLLESNESCYLFKYIPFRRSSMFRLLFFCPDSIDSDLLLTGGLPGTDKLCFAGVGAALIPIEASLSASEQVNSGADWSIIPLCKDINI